MFIRGRGFLTVAKGGAALGIHLTVSASVNEYVPVEAAALAEMVRTELPLAVAGFGANFAVTLEGKLERLSVTELLPPVAVNGAEIEKSPGSGFTVTDRGVVCTMLSFVQVDLFSIERSPQRGRLSSIRIYPCLSVAMIFSPQTAGAAVTLR